LSLIGYVIVGLLPVLSVSNMRPLKAF